MKGADIIDDPTFDMTVAAMRVSRAELDMASALGRAHRKDGTDLWYGRGDAIDVIARQIGLGRALEFVPREAPGNTQLGWEQQEDGDWEPHMAAAIDRAFASSIFNEIEALIPEDLTEEIGGQAVHIGIAIRRVIAEIAASPPHEWLRRALQEVAPSDGPVPDIAGVDSTDPIVDGGVPAP